ncbi:MAG TPA: hypothetical protein VKR06_09140 [Ktedonosporobacter sp.]|nr:hypothetical protein [Ktedonosporobacter sp.]
MIWHRAIAEERVAEAQTALRREQGEVVRLRQERDDAQVVARARAETDHQGILQLRAALQEAISDARRRAEEDRGEIKQLRETLAAATKRGDDFSLTVKSPCRVFPLHTTYTTMS